MVSSENVFMWVYCLAQFQFVQKDQKLKGIIDEGKRHMRNQFLSKNEQCILFLRPKEVHLPLHTSCPEQKGST